MKSNQWQVFKRLISYLRPYKWFTVLALSLLLLTTVVKNIIPLIASHFIDHYLTNVNQTAVLILVGYYSMYVLQTLIQYFGISFLRVFLIVLLEIFVEMLLLIWKG